MNDVPGHIVLGPQDLQPGDQPTLVVPPKVPTPEEAEAQRAAREQHQAELEQATVELLREQRRAQLYREWISTLFELAGLGIAAWGLSLLAVWLGVVVAGLGLIVVGVAIDPPQLRTADDDVTSGPGAEEGP